MLGAIQGGSTPWAELSGLKMRRLLVVRIRVRRTKKALARVIGRIAARKCVTCECETENANEATSARQQCNSCRGRINRMLAELTPAKQAEFLKKLIRQGLIILPHELRRLRAAQQSQVARTFEEVAERN